jgi:N utilization substance protein B
MNEVNIIYEHRHLSRSIVLQTLFEWDFLPTGEVESASGQKSSNPSNSASLKENLKEGLKRNLKEFAPGLEDEHFMSDLIDKVVDKKETIDKIIVVSAPEWPIEKISVVDRNILRIGLAELLFGDRKEVPPKVAINEAIELAKTFGGENSSKFINGVLGAVYKEMGEPGKEHQKNSLNSKDSKNSKDGGEIDVSKLPVSKKGGALVYARKDDGEIVFALVHDVFGFWTLSKGGIEEDENEEEGTKREIKQELGLDISTEENLGMNEYVATHPQNGKTLKKVVYFLARSEYKDLVLEKSGGLDNARWFKVEEIAGLRIYNDILPIITKAVEILKNKNK